MKRNKEIINRSEIKIEKKEVKEKKEKKEVKDKKEKKGKKKSKSHSGVAEDGRPSFLLRSGSPLVPGRELGEIRTAGVTAFPPAPPVLANAGKCNIVFWCFFSNADNLTVPGFSLLASRFSPVLLYPIHICN